MIPVNISLTPVQVRLVNRLTKQLGFANRSEFFRALVRWITTKPIVKEEVKVWPFVSPPVKSRKQVLNAFKKTGRYSKSFLQDLAEGLQNSNYFSK